MELSTPKLLSRLKRTLVSITCILCFGSGAHAQDLSQFNLSPEQMSRIASMDSATRAKLLEQLQGNAKTTSNAGDTSLRRDQIPAPTTTRYTQAVDFLTQSKLLSNQNSETDETDNSSDRDKDISLKLFGYEIFNNGNSFDPTIQLPIPVDYVMGVGDSVSVDLYGKTNATYELTVTREGNLVIPEIGPVSVSGSTFQEAKNAVLKKIKDHMIGVEASVTMGELRSIRVYIMGEVMRPGSYAVSSLATITNSLFACGGIKESGSLRSVRLMRSGKLVSEMDLYDLLLSGDNSHDSRLQPGDVILVPPIGHTASVSGSVIRPAIYEIKANTENVSDLLRLAGGCLPDAYLGTSQLKRIDSASMKRTVITVDLASATQQIVHNGDELTVLPISERVYNSVKISGHVALPRSLKWHEGMRVLDAIPSIGDLLPDADLLYVIIKRVNPESNNISVLSTRLDAAFSNPKSKWNFPLMPMDEIVVLNDGITFVPEQQDSFGMSYGNGINQNNIPINAQTDALSGTGRQYLQPYHSQQGMTPQSQPYYGQQGMQLSDQSNLQPGFRINASNNSFVGTRMPPYGDNGYAAIIDYPYLQDIGQHEVLERKQVIADIVDQLYNQRKYRDPCNTVIISGDVLFPDEYPYEQGMRVLDVMRAAKALTPDVDMNYALLIKDNNGVVSISDIKLPTSFDDENSEWNYPLQPHDELHIFSLYGDRASVIAPYLDRMRQQGTMSNLTRIVSISGQVHHPGQYPFRDGMHISDLLRAGSSFNVGAYTLKAELTRSVIENGRSFSVMHKDVNMAAILSGNADADLELQPLDNLMIRQIPDWSEDLHVKIGGEVNFPGEYSVKKGETMLQLIKRAGGFTDQASPIGSVFLRESLREKEQKQLDRLRSQLRANLAAVSVEKTMESNTKEFSNDLINQLESSKAVGRMAIDLPKMMLKDTDYPDLILKDGDVLDIPQEQQEIMVLGEVLYPTSHIFNKDLDYRDYIRMSGGTSSRADTNRIYIIKANGSVQTAQSSSRWFPSRLHIEPGDSIIVPFDTEYISPLPMWKDITGIIYNLAVSAAAVASF